MKPALAFAAAGLLGGLGACADQPVNDQEICARQAENDPAVKELIMKGAGSEHFQLEAQDKLRAAKQDATVACLRTRGVGRPGGVERQKPL